jgi:hypothetical protein
MAARKRLPDMMEVVQRCRYCGREMAVSASDYAESPFCEVCRPQRVAQAKPATVEWELRGRYLSLKRR